MPTILVVDDVPANVMLLEAELEDEAYEVISALSGEAALGLVEAEAPDLVILDVMMPGMSGLEVLAALREKHTLAELPIIMATGLTDAEYVVRALEMGANDYVTKPLEMAVVHARVRSQLQLRELSKLKDDFLSIASHDLRSPLQRILGFSRFLERRPLGEPVTAADRDMATQVVEATHAMGRIVEDFIDCEALDGDGLRLEIGSVDMAAAVRMQLVRSREYAGSRGIELVDELAEGLPPARADECRVGQVVQNLLDNAVKFSDDGGRVVVRARHVDGDVITEVLDSGPGLTEEDLARLFQKYARLSATPKGGEKSSGVGLFICKKLVELHGGRIGARPAPGGGACFWFSLPAGRA